MHTYTCVSCKDLRVYQQLSIYIYNNIDLRAQSRMSWIIICAFHEPGLLQYFYATATSPHAYMHA